MESYFHNENRSLLSNIKRGDYNGDYYILNTFLFDMPTPSDKHEICELYVKVNIYFVGNEKFRLCLMQFFLLFN